MTSRIHDAAQRVAVPPSAGMLRRRAAVNSDPVVAPAIVHDVLRSPGRPLDPATRTFMEPRFGRDFTRIPARSAAPPPAPARLAVGAVQDRSEQEADAVADRVTHMPDAPGGNRYDLGDVRVHTDPQAAESARSLNAQAYTVGQHIVFDAGEYEPHTASGRALLAHELAHVVQQSGQVSPRVQGRWRLDRVAHLAKSDIQYADGHAAGSSGAYGEGGGMSSGVLGRVNTWQEMGLVNMQDGGKAQVAHWVTKHYVFTNDAAEREFLELKVDKQVAGNAKAEDMNHARAAGVVWSRIAERTAGNPTPGYRPMFDPVEDGGISAATVGELGVIEAETPLPGGGSATITIPLTRVDEGEFVPFSESDSLPYDVPITVDEVDVVLGGRVEADAEIETSFIGGVPWISRNHNKSSAAAMFDLRWRSRPAPRPRPVPGTTGGKGAGGPTAPGPGADPRILRVRPALFRSGNASGPRIDHVRPGKPPDGDIEVVDGHVTGPGQGGVSTFQQAGSQKNWWRYPADTPEPGGITIRNDHGTHWAWEPSFRMKLDEYKSRLRSTVSRWLKVS